MVSVQILGSGDAFGSGGRFNTCIAVTATGVRCLIDCGASSLIAMKRFAVVPSDIDTILVSHLHGDHFGGIPFLLLEAQVVTARQRRLTIAGPPGVEARIRDTLELLFPGAPPVGDRFPLAFIELEEGTAHVIGPITVVPFAAVHPSGAPSYALRVTCDGKVIAFSGDTEWTEALVDAARGADLFICECHSFMTNVRYHLNYQTIQAERARWRDTRLILTHMSEEMLSRLSEVDAESAEDGQVITL